jgi:hypothetical protein
MLRKDVMTHSLNNILEQQVHIVQGFRLDIKGIVGKFKLYKAHQE